MKNRWENFKKLHVWYNGPIGVSCLMWLAGYNFNLFACWSLYEKLYNGILFLLLIRCIYKVGSLIGCKLNLQIFFHYYFQVQDINLINYLFLSNAEINFEKFKVIIIKLNVCKKSSKINKQYELNITFKLICSKKHALWV